MNMQQLMMQAQKMQREMQKAQAELAQKEFEISKGGAVTVKMKGDKTLISVNIDEDAIEKDNKDMLESLITMAINEIIEKIKGEEEAINSKVAGRSGGFGF